MVAFRGKSIVNTGVSGTTTVIPVPTGVTNGDKMYALVGSIASSPTVTPPAGWTLAGEFAPASTLKTVMFTRVVGANAEPASYTWTWSASGRSIGMCVAYSAMEALAEELGGVQAAPDPAQPASTYPFALTQAGDWMLTAVIGRENPGTDEPKTWTINDPLDAERHDTYSTNTGTGAKITAGWWDSNRNLTPGVVSRTITPSIALNQYHVWALRIAAVAVVTTEPVLPTDVATWSYIGMPLR